jgi:hypothetical protein
MDDHLSRDRLQRASPSRPKSGATNTRTYSMTKITKPDRLPVRPVLSCTAWGLSCPLGCPRGGELLPRHFTLTYSVQRHRRRYIFCDTFRHLTITMKCPGFHQACCRAVSGLSSESRRKTAIISGPFQAATLHAIPEGSERELRGGWEAGRLGDLERGRGQKSGNWPCNAAPISFGGRVPPGGGRVGRRGGRVGRRGGRVAPGGGRVAPGGGRVPRGGGRVPRGGGSVGRRGGGVPRRGGSVGRRGGSADGERGHCFAIQVIVSDLVGRCPRPPPEGEPNNFFARPCLLSRCLVEKSVPFCRNRLARGMGSSRAHHHDAAKGLRGGGESDAHSRLAGHLFPPPRPRS